MKTKTNKAAVAYYGGAVACNIKNCMTNPKMSDMLDQNYSMKRIWNAVKSEKDIGDLVYFYMAKKRQWAGCIGASLAQDALDYIDANRNKKTHELGEIYIK